MPFLPLGFVLVALVLSSCQSRQSPSGIGFLSSYAGFQRDSKFNDKLIYRGNLAKARAYDSIYLEEVAVFRPSDMAKKEITSQDLMRLQGLFRSALQEQVVQSRLALASGRGPTTLSLRAAITDITPGDPAMFAVSAAPYVGTATTIAGLATGAKFGKGSAKVEAEIVDSVTRERFAGVIDENVGSKLEIVQGMSRWGHVELAIDQWAKRFGKFLADPTAAGR